MGASPYYRISALVWNASYRCEELLKPLILVLVLNPQGGLGALPQRSSSDPGFRNFVQKQVRLLW